MYEFLFYSSLIISSYTTYRLWKLTARKRVWYAQVGIWSGRVLCTLIALILCTIQGARWFAPKGTWVNEIAHATEYYYKISSVNPPDLQWESIKYGEHSRNYMLLCNSRTVRPDKDKIIFFVHGGGWTLGYPELHLALAETFAQKGYWVVMPAYRLGPSNGYPELISDIRGAFKKTLEWRNQQGFQELDIVIGGTSAGGNLASLLLYDKQTWADLDSSALASVAGFFSIAGVLDLDKMPDSGALRNFAGERGSSQFQAANPITHLPAHPSIPALCLHGTLDGLVPLVCAQTFMEKLQAQGTKVEMHIVEGGTHLSVAGQWYYNRNNYHQQAEILLDWVGKLE